MPSDETALPWGGKEEPTTEPEARESLEEPKPKERKVAKEVSYHSPDDLLIVGLDTEDGEENALFDQRIFLQENEALIRNIMIYGVQQPVLCREEAGALYVVDGRQRVRAARVAAKRQDEAGEFVVKVPVLIAKGDDSRMHGIMVSANEIRESDEILGKALKASRMLDLVGDITEVGIAFGRSEQTIRNWLSLAGADPDIHDAVRSGKVSASAAIELANLPREEQVSALGELSNGTTVVTTTQAKKHKSTKGQRKTQPGVKRLWVKKAIKSETFKALDREHQEVLEWIATGNPSTGSWMDDFTTDLEGEGTEKATKKSNSTEDAKEVEDDSDSQLPF